MEIPEWKNDGGDGDVRINRNGGEEAGFSQTVERDKADAWRDSYYANYSKVPKTVDNQAEWNVDRTAIICEFLLGVGLTKANLFGDLF